MRRTDSIYNSKELVVDSELTFLSYNQTVNAEFTVEEILDSPLWIVNSDNGLIKAIPLFNCDKITSSNESDKVLDSNKCIILENNVDTIVKCISDDTGSMHYHSVELYAYAPYTKLDVISEVTVYCILYDEYLNTLGNVNVDVYIDNELTGSVVSDSNGVCRFHVDQPCTVWFVYGELESNDVAVGGSQVYSLSIETDKESLFADESVTITGVLTFDGSPYADQSISLYDGASLVDTLTTDSNGEYMMTVTGLSVGTHVFRAMHARVRSSTASVTVTEHDYSLTVTGDSILQSGDTDNIIATLKDNSVVVSGEILSYTIKHGSTVIDSGSDTTDSNGEISISYTGTGAGDVEVIVSYGSLLQETYDVIDYVSYDDATTDKSSKYIIANLNSHTFSTDHYVAERTLSASASATYYSLVHETYNLPTDFEASVDLLVTDKSTSDHQFGLCISPDYPETYSGTNQCFLYSNRNRFALGYRINGSLSNYGTYNSDFSTNTWYTFYIKVQGTTVTTTIKQGSNTIQSYTGTHSNIQSWKKLMLVIGGNSNNMYWKNLKIKAL